MYLVYYVYEKIERERVMNKEKPFDVKKIRVSEKIGEYKTLKEAKWHPICKTEELYNSGYYLITQEEQEEIVLI